jgi:hypothetical protein
MCWNFSLSFLPCVSQMLEQLPPYHPSYIAPILLSCLPPVVRWNSCEYLCVVMIHLVFSNGYNWPGYHSASGVLNDTLFCFVDFHDTTPPFNISIYLVWDLLVSRSAAKCVNVIEQSLTVLVVVDTVGVCTRQVLQYMFLCSHMVLSRSLYELWKLRYRVTYVWSSTLLYPSKCSHYRSISTM